VLQLHAEIADEISKNCRPRFYKKVFCIVCCCCPRISLQLRDDGTLCIFDNDDMLSKFYRCVRLRVHVCNYAEHLMDAVSIGVVSESHAARVRICSPCFACPSSIASWSKRSRRREIFDVKLTFVRMQNRLFPFYAHVYCFKQADRSSFSLLYVNRAIADPLAPWCSTLCVYSVAPGSLLEEPYCVHETPVPHVVQIMSICWVV
jgi:hypothetical protein